MQLLPLSQLKTALVDDFDLPALAAFKWSYRAECDNKQGYAVRHHKVNGKDRLLYLQRHLMQPPEGMEVIFRNHDRLDCRRENLAVVTKEEARQHHRVRHDSKTGAKGVRYNEESDTWSAVIYRDGRGRTIGTFDSQASAQQAYESELRRENPDLHAAPDRVEVAKLPPRAPRTNPSRGASKGQ